MEEQQIEYYERLLEDGRKIVLQPLMWGMASLGICRRPPFNGIYENQWDFPNFIAADIAYWTWKPEEDIEPPGRHRHMKTGRYRIGGKQELEYVKDDTGNFEERIIRAILVTQGQDRIVLGIEKLRWRLEALPGGAQHHEVCSNHEIGDNRTCTHYDHVYVYCDRIVVLDLADIARGRLKTVIRRLTDDVLLTEGKGAKSV